jgi:vacuolar-type H+-ATPase subunit H
MIRGAYMMKQRLSETELSPVVAELAQQLDQLDGIVKSMVELQYDFGKKLKQIDTLVSQSGGVLLDGEDSKFEHLDSLTKLAERTLVEADKIASGVRQEAEDDARAKAASIIAKAEEQAQAEAQRIVAEARSQAKEAASQEAQAILGGINEVKGIFEKAYQNVLANLSKTD